MSRYFHQQDPGRLVHYEGVFWNRAFDGISDVESRMYAPPRQVQEYLESGAGKPYLCAVHALHGQLAGRHGGYIRLLDEYPRYQGGFIWDYMDQASGALMRWAAGCLPTGRFRRTPTDYAFSGNGLCLPTAPKSPPCRRCVTGTRT